MKSMIFKLSIFLILGAGWYFTAAAQNSPAGEPAHTGVKKCKMCHNTVKLGGVEYKQWEKSKHAKTYELLATDKAKELAAKMGVKDPQNDEKCLKCHITTLKFTSPEQRAEGVGCERCHGPGSLYNATKTMKDHAASVAAGMRDLKDPDADKQTAKIETLCRECHGLEHKDENPAAKEFNFKEGLSKTMHDEKTLRAEFPELFAK